jgi:hypothetical protein
MNGKTMNRETNYIGEKYEDIELLENFVPLLNKKDQAKLAFIEAIPQLIEKNDKEIAKLQFRFICEGVNGSRTITYTGWLKEALSEASKLGLILKGFKIVDFNTPKAVKVEEFNFEENFKPSEGTSNKIQFEELLNKLSELEGTIILAKLTNEKGVWLRPDPISFDFPVNKDGDFYKVDVSDFKNNKA